MTLQDLIGKEVVGKDGKRLPTSDVKAKVVMLYFSAHWCPPCRGFTPALVQWYKTQKENGADLEIVFVSSDKDQTAFDSYYAEVPWLAMPYSERDLKSKLSKKLKVSGIPTLVLANQDGVVYQKEGRKIVSGDPDGKQYPWMPPTLAEALGTTFVRNDGTQVNLSDLKGKHIALSFSATWCPPCRAFFPTMKEAYEKVNSSEKKWEIIFVSSDNDQAEFDGYFGKMPWLAVPYEDRARKNALSEYFEVEGIPTLIQLGPDLGVVNKALRGALSADTEGKEFPWSPKPVQSISEGAGDINDMPALVALMEDETGTTQAQFDAILSEVAASHKQDKNKDEALFLTSKSSGGVADRIRELTVGSDGEKEEAGSTRTLCNGDMCLKLKKSTRVVILDVPDDGAYYTFPGELTRENIAKFWTDFSTGSLREKRQQLG